MVDADAATFYIGNYYEVTNGVATKYYYFGAQRVAMRNASGVTYLHSDHLGSTSVASTQTGALVSRQTYYAFGVPRTTEGTLPTDYTFTGQKSDSYIKLIQMGARWYDYDTGRFIQPDTIIPSPGNPQSLNRYSYVLNNPVKYTDPTGHRECEDDSNCTKPAYTCNEGQGCTGDLPDITASCDSSGCMLDPRLNKAISFYARVFGIPTDLLYTTLLTEQLTDTSAAQNLVNKFNLRSARQIVDGPTDYAILGGYVDLAVEELLYDFYHSAYNPGAGYNNIHSRSVWSAQDYFASTYPGTSATSLVGTNQNLATTIITLSTTDGNIKYSAAILRQLADQRTNTLQAHIGDLSVTDEAIIYRGYREGVGPGRTFGSVDIFRAATEPGNSGRLFLQYYR